MPRSRLGRLADPTTMRSVALRGQDSDPTVRFVSRRALRSIAEWQALSDSVGAADPDLTREWILAAVGVYDAGAVEFLANVARQGANPSVRAEAVAAIAEVDRKADPYQQGWWGTRPAAGEPSRKRVHEWEGTELVLSTLREALGSDVEARRLAAIRALLRVNDPLALAQVRQALTPDNAAERSFGGDRRVGRSA
ncbi:MAG: hypothetical protein R3B96_18355 [Pirellulaceae bacterium]